MSLSDTIQSLPRFKLYIRSANDIDIANATLRRSLHKIAVRK